MAIEKYSNKGLGQAKWSFPPVHPEGRKFALIAAAITAAFAFLAWETLAWPMAGITIWVLAFFRDPKRVTPLDDDYIVAPADGLVRSEEHTSELQSRENLVCRLLLEKKK